MERIQIRFLRDRRKVMTLECTREREKSRDQIPWFFIYNPWESQWAWRMPGCWVVLVEHSVGVRRWCPGDGRWGGEVASRRRYNFIRRFRDQAVHLWVSLTYLPQKCRCGKKTVCESGMRFWQDSLFSWGQTKDRSKEERSDGFLFHNWMVSSIAFSLSESLGLISFLGLN